MTRTIPSSIISKLSNDQIFPFYTVDLLFDDTPVYVWTGLGELTIEPKTYLGAGTLLSISEVGETKDVSARGVTVSISGIPSEYLALALQDPYQGRKCIVNLGFMDSWESPTASPDLMQIFSGYMDQMTIEEGPESSIITISVESRLIDLERARNRRYTSQNQKSRFPNDKAFEFVNSLQDQRLSWGSSDD
jgi:hypothetical protein